MQRLTYEARAAKHLNPAARALLEVMARKRSNLCVSVDVTSKESFLRIVDAAGPSICLVKVSRIFSNVFVMLSVPESHIDIIEDFDDDLIVKLVELSKKHDFLIFEDRKFADIGT
jgi:orotidine-5'-phosphate decarboxylase